jgi:hypothetical protein
MGKGIDYGLGQTNIDLATGIRFGVIPAMRVDFWYDAAEPSYPKDTCPEPDCGAERDDTTSENADGSDLLCAHCGFAAPEEQWSADDPAGYFVDEEGIKAFQGESGDIFVEVSPYFTRAEFCSPCAPGACYLTHATEEGARAYCFPHDWFEDGRAPYPVFSVATGERVLPVTPVRKHDAFTR